MGLGTPLLGPKGPSEFILKSRNKSLRAQRPAGPFVILDFFHF